MSNEIGSFGNSSLIVIVFETAYYGFFEQKYLVLCSVNKYYIN